jgi:protein tyrosine/serine phosphatase
MRNQQHTNRIRTVVLCALIALVGTITLWLYSGRGVFSTNSGRTNSPSVSYIKWAQPIEMEGVPNLHKVSDTLYRGAQPTEDGMRNLENLGIKTVLNLRSLHSDRDEIADANVDYEHIWMKAWHAETEDVVRFLKVVTDPNRTPVFVHCQHGADRTGTMCAMYRIAVQGWSKDDAIKEMTEGGFNFHGVWDNLIEYIRNVDVNDVRIKAGLRN